MARFRVVLSAVARAAGRGSKGLRQVSGNNMFYAGVTLMFMLDAAAMALFLTLICLVLFLPSSGDPLTAVPRERLDLWPLTRRERYALRLVSPLLNPLTWVILAGLVWRRVTWGLWAFVAGFFLSGFIGSWFGMPNVWVPRIPAGRLTQLVRKDLRQFLTALDLYCALLLAVPAGYLRTTGELPESAYEPLTALITIILSTMALTLFGLDGDGLVRYRLWPIAGWRVLAAKGIAYLLLTVVVTVGLAPASALGGGLMALALGQWHAVKDVIPQSRWRFRASRPFGVSLVQMLGAMAGFGVVSQLGVVWVGVPVAVYGVSLWVCGRRLGN